MLNRLSQAGFPFFQASAVLTKVSGGFLHSLQADAWIIPGRTCFPPHPFQIIIY
jgi:hypothetical protein